HQPPGNDAQALDQALLQPEHELVGLLKQVAVRCALALAPAPVAGSLLLHNRKLDHRQCKILPATIPLSTPALAARQGTPAGIRVSSRGRRQGPNLMA